MLFGGKGGVGKTTTACASAIAFAESGLKTLLITTDPAGSIGDAMEIDGEDVGWVRDGFVGVMKVEGVDGGDGGGLWVAEMDIGEVVEELREVLKGVGGGGGGGIGGGVLSGWSEVFKEVPPGFDEVLGLSMMVEMVEGGGVGGLKGFDRVVVDTAPTGHTVRLLTLPDFISGMLDTAVRFKREIGTVASMMNMGKVVGEAEVKIEKWKERIERVGDMLNDPVRTEFVLVCVPTKLAIAETRRLRRELADTGVYARFVVANRMLEIDAEKDGRHKVLDRVAKRHKKIIEIVKLKYKNLNVQTVPLWDSEIKGIYALIAFAPIVFPTPQPDKDDQIVSMEDDARFDGLFDKNGSTGKSKIVFVGGKGGVGKTTTAATLGAKLALNGFKTLVMSTDPAHSLGDCLDMELEPGRQVEIPLRIAGEMSGSLSALEVDARGEVDRLLRKRVEGVPGLEGVLDTLPPGVDEVVALGKVVQAMSESGSFDRVVVDTAPTGHTLRLLSLPVFLDGLLGKLARLVARGTVGGVVDTVRTAIGKKGGSSNGKTTERWGEELERVRKNIQEVKKVIEDKKRSQFIVVTIPTEVAMAETERLIETLSDGRIEVRNLIVNQVIEDNNEGLRYARRLWKAQQKCVEELRAFDDVDVVEVPWMDEEVKGVHGLRAIAKVLLPEESERSN